MAMQIVQQKPPWVIQQEADAAESYAYMDEKRKIAQMQREERRQRLAEAAELRRQEQASALNDRLTNAKPRQWDQYMAQKEAIDRQLKANKISAEAHKELSARLDKMYDVDQKAEDDNRHGKWVLGPDGKTRYVVPGQMADTYIRPAPVVKPPSPHWKVTQNTNGEWEWLDATPGQPPKMTGFPAPPPSGTDQTALENRKATGEEAAIDRYSEDIVGIAGGAGAAREQGSKTYVNAGRLIPLSPDRIPLNKEGKAAYKPEEWAREIAAQDADIEKVTSELAMFFAQAEDEADLKRMERAASRAQMPSAIIAAAKAKAKKLAPSAPPQAGAGTAAGAVSPPAQSPTKPLDASKALEYFRRSKAALFPGKATLTPEEEKQAIATAQQLAASEGYK